MQQLLPTEALLNELPPHPMGVTKASCEGKHNYCLGYEVHLAVSSHIQYILSTLTMSVFVSNLSVAIPFMRSVFLLGSTGVYAILYK
ncbi:hypothetical protein IGI37_000773 [Enterococcus sp. AZ194]